MRTNADEDDDLEIPEFDWSRAVPNRFARRPGERSETRIDGAVGYALRLIPSNKVLAQFGSTLDAWPMIVAAVDGGRSPRTLALDWIDAAGVAHKLSAGPRLVRWARLKNGEPHPNAAARPPGLPRRVAELRPG
jgi:hypothetical protein